MISVSFTYEETKASGGTMTSNNRAARMQPLDIVERGAKAGAMKKPVQNTSQNQLNSDVRCSSFYGHLVNIYQKYKTTVHDTYNDATKCE